MTDAFVPVDLDKVLDEFEQQEHVNTTVGKVTSHENAVTNNSFGDDFQSRDNEYLVSSKPASMSFLHAFADEDVSRRHTVTENDFNSKELPGVSIHDELIACNRNGVGGTDSDFDGTASDTSSTSAVIAAAEEITTQVKFDEKPSPQNEPTMNTDNNKADADEGREKVDERKSDASESCTRGEGDDLAGSDFVSILQQVASDGTDKPMGSSPLASYAGIWSQTTKDDEGQAIDDEDMAIDNEDRPTLDGGQVTNGGGWVTKDESQARNDEDKTIGDEGQATDSGGQATDGGGQVTENGVQVINEVTQRGGQINDKKDSTDVIASPEDIVHAKRLNSDSDTHGHCTVDNNEGAFCLPDVDMCENQAQDESASKHTETVVASLVDELGPDSSDSNSSNVNYIVSHVNGEVQNEEESNAIGSVNQNVDSHDKNCTSCDSSNVDTITGISGAETVASENVLKAQELNEPTDESLAHKGVSIGMRNISPGESLLGNVAPVWVPDAIATHCMNCGLKFTIIKRRHHCRACGKALCSSCCNLKYALPYLFGKEVRVCQVCCNALLRAQAISQVLEDNEQVQAADNQTENEALCSEQDTQLYTVRNGIQTTEQGSEPERFVSRHPQENGRQDMLGGGLGVELDPQDDNEPRAEEASQSNSITVTSDHLGEQVHPVGSDQDSGAAFSVSLVSPPQSPLRFTTDRQISIPEPPSPALSDDSDIQFRLDVDYVRSLMPEETSALPPVLSVVNGAVTIQEKPDPAEIMYQLKGKGQQVVFLLNKNLTVKLKIVKMNCCVKRKCWCFVTEGMGAANQEEMVVLLECLHKENAVPKDVLSHFNTAFAYAKQGHVVSDLGFTIFGQPFLGSSNNAGFLYVKPTFQCLENLPLPSTPYVVGILIQRTETPWAQLFPLRLKLRLGAEFRYYPCPLWSVRDRPVVYGDIGHTIMNLLADFKNFQYTLPRVAGMVIHMEEKRTIVRLPQDRYDEVLKVLNGADEFVMAFQASFSTKADSHLVCMQSDHGYKTQAINIQNQPRQVTGASFVVFNGALKSSSPYTAKLSIVEDGIMVQMNSDNLQALRQALREMHDFSINTGIPGKNPEQHLFVEWVPSQETSPSHSVCSPVDGMNLDSYPCIKVHSSCDFTRPNLFRIQWTDVYMLSEGSSSQHRSKDLSRLTANIAKACCDALMPHLESFWLSEMRHIGLRVNMDRDSEGYLIGSQGKLLSSDLLTELDNELVPALNEAANTFRGGALSVELLLRVTKLL